MASAFAGALFILNYFLHGSTNVAVATKTFLKKFAQTLDDIAITGYNVIKKYRYRIKRRTIEWSRKLFEGGRL